MSIASEIKFLIEERARWNAVLEEEETPVLSTENEVAYEHTDTN